MNNYLLVSLGIMLLLLFVGQAYEISEFSIPESNTYTFDETTGQFIVNGSDTSMTIGEQNLVLGISLTEGIMITGIAIGALIFIIGIKVLDSGLSDFAQKGIVNLALFGAIWAIFSTLTYQLITAIDILGWFLFFIISMIHFLGIMTEINGVK